MDINALAKTIYEAECFVKNWQDINGDMMKEWDMIENQTDYIYIANTAFTKVLELLEDKK